MGSSGLSSSRAVTLEGECERECECRRECGRSRMDGVGEGGADEYDCRWSTYAVEMSAGDVSVNPPARAGGRRTFDEEDREEREQAGVRGERRARDDGRGGRRT